MTCPKSGSIRESFSIYAPLFAAGLLVALLARPEYGIALTALAALLLPRVDGRGRRLSIVLAGASAWVVAALAGALALRGLFIGPGTAGPFSFLHPPPEWGRLYRNVAGISTPFRVAGKFLLSSFALAAVLAAASAWARLAAGRRTEGARTAMRVTWSAAALAAGAGLGAAAARAALRPTWGPLVDLLLPIPVASLALAGMACLSRTPGALPRVVLFSITALWSARVIFSLTVGYRMNPYDGPAVPFAVASLAVVVFDLWGDRLADRDDFRRNAGAVFAAIGVFFLVRTGIATARDHARPVRTAVGALRLGPGRADAVGRTIDFLESAGSASVVPLPEGGFFTFVTGAGNPLRQEQILPGMLTVGAEDDVVARIRAARPIVLIMNRPTREFGKGREAFGRDYAQRIFRTVEDEYECAFSTIDDACSSPIGSPRFFVHGYRAKGGPRR